MPDTQSDQPKKFIGVYFKDNPQEFSENYHIVLNGKYEEAKISLVHDYLPFKTDRQAQRMLNQHFSDAILVGITWKEPPFYVGHKRIGSMDEEYLRNSLDIICTPENQLKKLYNEFKQMNQLFAYEEYKNYFAKNPYELEKIITEDKAAMLCDVLKLTTLEEANEVFWEYVEMKPGDEFFVQKNYLDRSNRNQALLAGILPRLGL